VIKRGKDKRALPVIHMIREYLFKHRRLNNLSMNAFADQLGISRNYYEALEKGKKGDKLTLETAYKISKALSITIDDVLTFEINYKRMMNK